VGGLQLGDPEREKKKKVKKTETGGVSAAKGKKARKNKGGKRGKNGGGAKNGVRLGWGTGMGGNKKKKKKKKKYIKRGGEHQSGEGLINKKLCPGRGKNAKHAKKERWKKKLKLEN